MIFFYKTNTVKSQGLTHDTNCAKKGKGMGLYIEMVDNLLVNITADGATLQHP